MTFQYWVGADSVLTIQEARLVSNGHNQGVCGKIAHENGSEAKVWLYLDGFKTENDGIKHNARMSDHDIHKFITLLPTDLFFSQLANI